MSAEEFKAKGNAALQAKNFTEAIEFYTKAINVDGGNHVYYSNRSAAYLSKGDAHNALEDANAVIGLQPDFAKGYSRKGAALHALKRYNDSITTYQQGLAQFPNDAGLKSGLASVQKEKDGGPSYGNSGAAGGGAGGGLFSPQMLAQMALNPQLRPFLNDPDVMAKIKMIQQNPNLLQSMLADPKMMQLLSVMMGGNNDDDDDNDGMFGRSASSAAASSARASPGASATSAAAAAASDKPKEHNESMQEEPEEDWSDLPEDERKVKEAQKAAQAKKNEGNELYKGKQFEEALAAYDAALELDPTNMAFLSNKAAVYFTQRKYQECIDTCLAAVELGKEHRAPFEDRAKALTRAARSYQALGDLGAAIDLCQKAQLEYYDKGTQRLLKTMELEKKKADAAAYQDESKAEEAKQRGNDFFRQQQYGQAVAEYEEAVKRAPKNAAIRNNLAAALCKVMDFSGAQRQIETALELDPKYVKAWARKGEIEMYMKEYHKAQESFQKGLELDVDNTACKDGLRKCIAQISYGRSSMTDDEKKEQAAHAMADPQIQAILQDPVMQQVLRDFQENPTAAQQAIQNPGVREKINKLIAAGIIETR